MSPLSAQPAESDDPPAEDEKSSRERALELFEQSDAKYKQGKFQEAATLLEQAYALEPEPVLLYNLARAYDGLGEYEKAIDAYQRYLKAVPDAKDRGALERRIETLQAQLSDRKRLEADQKRLEEERSRPAPPPPTAEPAAQGPGPWPWLTIGVGVSAVAAGAFFGIRAGDQRDEADEEPVQRDAAEKLRNAESSASAANVFLVAGAAITAGGVLWLVLGQPKKSERAGLQLGIAPNGVRLKGSL